MLLPVQIELRHYVGGLSIPLSIGGTSWASTVFLIRTLKIDIRSGACVSNLSKYWWDQLGINCLSYMHTQDYTDITSTVCVTLKVISKLSM